MDRLVINDESMKKPAPAQNNPSCRRERGENHMLDWLGSELVVAVFVIGGGV